MRHQAISLPWWKDQVADEINVYGACLIGKSHAQLAASTALLSGPVSPALAVPATVGVPTTILLTDTISPPGDTDAFGFNLTAGRTYMISLYGSGVNPLQDTVVALFNNLGMFINLDDDGGSGTNSILTFTATYSGLHIIQAQAYPGSGLTGQYTLDVLLKPLGDVVGDTFGGAPLLNLGVNYGFIDAGVPPVYGPAASETDTFAINMTAGQFYTIEVAGGADYASNYLALPAGELDPIVFLYDDEGNLVASNDDISFPSDISSRIGFFAEESGTYYLDVQSYAPWTGGYSVTLDEVDLSTLDPRDSLNWFSADNIDVGPGGVVKIFFAPAGESYDELADNGIDPLPSFGWNAFEKQQVLDAMQEFSKILGFTYVETTNEAEAEFRLITTTSEQYGAYFYPQDPAFGDAQGIGVFNVDSGGWNFDQQQSLLQGGFAYAVILHEFGHAHGLAHPHDNGGGSEIMPGVTGPFDSLGVFDMNQGVYTVMSYNDAWQLHPDGPSPFTAAGVDNGWSGTLSALDIATLQQRYGIINAYATGNDVYQLDDVQDVGTYYETIWDTGGTDVIRYSGERDAQIDLTAATIDYSATGGGVISFVDGIHGGYTIANGVVIENATGDEGNDILIGNSAANVLTGDEGDDSLLGRAGNDTLNGGNHDDTLDGGDNDDTLNGNNHDDVLNGGAGNDTLNGNNHADVLNGGAGNDVMTGGNHKDMFVFTEIGGADRIMDFNRGAGEKIDLSAIDAVAGGADNAFTFIGGTAFTGSAGQLRAYISGSQFFVEGDVDGNGVADFSIQTNMLMLSSDFIL